MPRRSILSAAERDSLLALPATQDELIRHYTLSETDLSIIRQHRKPANQQTSKPAGFRRPALLYAPSWRDTGNRPGAFRAIAAHGGHTTQGDARVLG